MAVCLITDQTPAALALPPLASLHVGRPGEPLPEASLYIWDVAPEALAKISVSGLDRQRHVVLVDPDGPRALAERLGTAVVVLKPVSAITLRALIELAHRSESCDEQVDQLRSDRDALLQYVLELNEKLQRYDAERDQFLARALHDFRSPLTALHGYCGLLADGKFGRLSAAQLELLQKMRRSTGRLTRLAADTFQLLVEARFRRVPRANAGDMAAVVRQALDEVAPWLEEKSIAVEIEVEPSEREAYFDGEQLAQVLVNLLENACRYTSRHGRLRIRGGPVHHVFRGNELASGKDSRPNAFQIHVEDDGPGIPVSLSNRIFEQFSGGTDSAERGGAGLGLAICRLIIEAHHGEVWAEPSQHGAHFTYVLPFSRVGTCPPPFEVPRPERIEPAIPR